MCVTANKCFRRPLTMPADDEGYRFVLYLIGRHVAKTGGRDSPQRLAVSLTLLDGLHGRFCNGHLRTAVKTDVSRKCMGVRFFARRKTTDTFLKVAGNFGHFQHQQGRCDDASEVHGASHTLRTTPFVNLEPAYSRDRGGGRNCRARAHGTAWSGNPQSAKKRPITTTEKWMDKSNGTGPIAPRESPRAGILRSAFQAACQPELGGIHPASKQGRA